LLDCEPRSSWKSLTTDRANLRIPEPRGSAFYTLKSVAFAKESAAGSKASGAVVLPPVANGAQQDRSLGDPEGNRPEDKLAGNPRQVRKRDAALEDCRKVQEELRVVLEKLHSTRQACAASHSKKQELASSTAKCKADLKQECGRIKSQLQTLQTLRRQLKELKEPNFSPSPGASPEVPASPVGSSPNGHTGIASHLAAGKAMSSSSSAGNVARSITPSNAENGVAAKMGSEDERGKLPSEETRSAIRSSIDRGVTSGDLVRAMAIVEKDAAKREKDVASSLEKTRALLAASLDQAIASGALSQAIAVVANGQDPPKQPNSTDPAPPSNNEVELEDLSKVKGGD